jgi:flavin-dependent dehydrogenase
VVLDGAVAARVVIAADGANSVVRRQVQPRPPEARGWAVALRGYAEPRTAQPDRLLIAVAREDCPSYAWSFPLADGRANVGFGVFARAVDGGRAELLDRLHAELPDLSLDGSTVRAHHLPLTTGRPALPDGRVLLAGDAAGLVNPLTGEGIYYAALSGVLAADAAVLGPAAGAAYRTALTRLLQRHHRHTAAVAALSRSPRFVEAALAAAAASQRTFDDVVELGLGRGTAEAHTVLSLGASWLRGLVPGRPAPQRAQARRSQTVASAGSSRAPSGSGTLEASTSASAGSGTDDAPVLASTSTSPLRNASTSSP